MKVHIPDFKRIEEFTKRVGMHWRTSPYKQELKITEPYSIPKVPEDSTILVFAGSIGDVTNKLNAKKFIFTDLVEERVRVAKQKSPEEFREKTDFLTCDAKFQPFKDNCADFSFSFEPIPLYYTPHFLLELIRCSKKGIIFAQAAPKLIAERKRHRYMEKLYGFKRKSKTIKIKGLLKETIPCGKLLIDLYKITEETKQRAAIDLKIIQKANEIAEEKGTLTREDLEEVKKLLGMDEKVFVKAIKRVSALMIDAADYLVFEAEY